VCIRFIMQALHYFHEAIKWSVRGQSSVEVSGLGEVVELGDPE
jgi:hypothetical protein